ncbi:MAG: hypothetical protein JWP52_2836 [Rhizobacter sp.]|nr:hypothetical protein [Rhizobacter sp.]
MLIVKPSSNASAFTTLSGTAQEVRSHLSGVKKTEQVIALTFDHSSKHAVHAIADTMASIAPLVDDIIERRQRAALESIVEALVPTMAPPEHLMVEARMTARARKAVVESGDWLSAAQIAELAGFSASNPSTQPNKWKKDGLIFAIRLRGCDYFPAYGLDPLANHRPVKAMADVLKAFGELKDAWGSAYWFASVNSFLGGARPQDMLASDPDRVIAAALDEIAETAHG